MENIGTQTLITQRLTLRKFNLNDVQSSFENWASDCLMTRYLTWNPHSTPNDTQLKLKQWIDSYDDLSFYQWAIELNATNNVIGTISVVNLNQQLQSVELGYCIGSNYWHQGYMKEAVNAIVEFFFTKVKVNRISAKHCIDNINSGRVLIACGFYNEGISYQSHLNNQGKFIDMVNYGLTSKHYFHYHQSKNLNYHQEIIDNCKALLSDQYALSNLCNVAALLYEKIPYLNWVGYYFLKNNELILGPFQGKIACNPLQLNKGVCAACVNSQEITIVNDVHTFKDHIACDSASNSEIVLPLFNNNGIIGVLDIDSPIKNRFDTSTINLITEVSKVINEYLKNHH